ncbi:MAG: ABC transporter ATP-binding protein [bacterium]
MSEKKPKPKQLGKYLSLSLKLQWELTRWHTISLPLIDLSTTLISIGRSYVYAQIINLIAGYIAGKVDTVFPQFWYLVLIAGIAGLAEPLIRNLQDYQITKTQVMATYKLDRIIAERCAELDAEYFEDPKFQDTLSRVQRLNINWVLRNMSNILSDIVTIVIATIAVLNLNVILFALAVFSALPRFLSSMYSAKYYRKLRVEMSQRSRFNWYLRDSLTDWSHLREIRPAGAVKAFMKRLISNQDELAKMETTAQKKFSIIEGSADSIGIITAIVTRIWLFMRIITTRGAFGIGDYTFYDSLIQRLENSSSSLVRNFRNIYEELINVEDFFTLMNAQPKIKQINNPIQLDKGNHVPTIEFRNVTFTYPGTTKKILKGVSFHLQSREKMALIGINGAGKTTIVKLLLRFYDPDQGEILIDGINLRDIETKSWYKKLAVIQQDFNRYPLTAAQNITFEPTRKADPAKLKKAISDAQAGFIYELPKGANTILTRYFDESVDLSGGQWQKVALARAFYRQSPILVLDEPTSAIDARAEAEIFHQLWKMQDSKGAIVISHRFSTVRNADQIIVLDGGKVVEHGNHEELMKSNGVYHELFTKQARSYQ